MGARLAEPVGPNPLDVGSRCQSGDSAGGQPCRDRARQQVRVYATPTLLDHATLARSPSESFDLSYPVNKPRRDCAGRRRYCSSSC
jgi:hypothetical protein